VAQFAGGILGALLLWGTFSCSPLYSRSTTGLGADGWGTASHIHINARGAFLTDVVALSQVWLFIVAPLLGGTIAAAVHLKLYRRPGQEVLEVGQAS